MKQFQVAATESVLENPVELDFELAGYQYVAYPPSSGQITLLLATQAGGATGPEIANAMLRFLLGVFGDEQYKVFEDGLNDRSIDMEVVMEVIQWMIEEWSTRPTPSASVSSQRSAATTKRSTAKKPARAKTPST